MGDENPPNYEIAAGKSHLAIPLAEHSTSWEEIDVSIDLLVASLWELEFLSEIDRKHSDLHKNDVINNAIRRYETVWMKILAKCEVPSEIIPPVDVHWIWHCHMLNPIAYKNDCETLIGKFIDHQMVSSQEREMRRPESVTYWENMTPNEPFDYHESLNIVREDPWYEQKCSYKLHDAAERQRLFNYQVSLPHYFCLPFLEQSVERYKQFLFLKKHYPDQFLTPCYDFDLVWHAHQVNPGIYSADTQRITGKLLPHDDSVNDRSPNSRLLHGESTTKQLWKFHFQFEKTTFWRRGGMFRGHDHPSILALSKELELKVNHGRIDLRGSLKKPYVEREELKLQLSFGDEKIGKSVQSVGYALRDQWRKGEDKMEYKGSFVFDLTERQRALTVSLKAFDYGFLRRKNLIDFKGKCPMNQLLPPNSSSTDILLSNSSESENVQLNLESRLSQDRYFSVIHFDFINEEISIDKNDRYYNFIYAAALNKHPLRHREVESFKTWRADHRLIDLVDSTSYTVRVVHSAELLLSLILIIDSDGKIQSMLHLLGPESLPTIEQLGSLSQDEQLAHIPTLSTPSERAVLISDAMGDFAIIHGIWEGFVPRRPPQGTFRGEAGKPGGLSVKFFKFRNQGFQNFHLDLRNLQIFLEDGSVSTVLSGNSITMTNVRTDVANHIASIFGISLLFSLTNPDRVRSLSSPAGGGFNCQKWPLVVAAGYCQPSPSIRYLAFQHTSGGEDEADGGGVGSGTIVSDGYQGHLGWWTIGAAEALEWDAAAVAAGVGSGEIVDSGTSGLFDLGNSNADDGGDFGACAGCGSSLASSAVDSSHASDAFDSLLSGDGGGGGGDSGGFDGGGDGGGCGG